jgi:hypothetical protein
MEREILMMKLMVLPLWVLRVCNGMEMTMHRFMMNNLKMSSMIAQGEFRG